MTRRIAIWSGPRNLSTAFLRAWENRADTAVLDEPFYGAYLAATGLDHPMRATVQARHPTDWDDCARLCATAIGAPLIVQKHMAHHMVAGAPLDWMDGLDHVFLIRDPRAVAASFRRGWPGMGVEDLGFHALARLFARVRDRTGTPPPVIDTDQLARTPGPLLARLCDRLGVAMDPAMLHWPAGARASDGVWAPHWYASVRASTGFRAPADADADDPPDPDLAAIAQACAAPHALLSAHRLDPVAP